MDKSEYGVHRTHCCVLHGCKYSDDDCPVVNRIIEQEYICEECDENGITDIDSVKMILSDDDNNIKNHFYQLQVLTDAFNKKYFSAVGSSDATEYFDAALLGRQVVNYLCKHAIVTDYKP